jgi:glycosyltransferase involved in cell wall biosynthesis
MRIRHVGDESASVRAGGLNTYVTGLSAALRGLGVDSDIQVVGNAAPGEVSVHSVESPLVRRIVAHRTAMRGAAADLVDVHFAVYAELAPSDQKYVAHFHGPWAAEAAEQGRSLGGRARNALEGRVLRRAERVVVLSKYMADLVIGLHDLDPSRIIVIRPGLDLNRFNVGSQTDARDRLELPRDIPIAVCVRRLVRRTGVDLLIDAWRSAQFDGVLVIVGTGPEEGRLRAAASGMSNVRFLGSVEDSQVVAVYQAADISVMPSRSLEGFGLAAIESLACGTPVIGTNIGGLPDVLRGFPGCPVVEPDVEPLAAALVEGLTGEHERQRLRTGAEEFDWHKVAVRHVELYEEVLSS